MVVKPRPLKGPIFGLPFSSSTRFHTMIHFIQLRTALAAPAPARAIVSAACGSRRGGRPDVTPTVPPAGSGPAPPGAPAPNVIGPTSENVASKPPSVEYMFLSGNRSCTRLHAVTEPTE